MRRAGITMIILLLVSATSGATVYVWKDADALVMTNDATEVPARVDEHELTTYATAETTPDESPQRLVTVRADGTAERTEAEKPQPGPAGVVTSAADPAEAAPGAAAPAPGERAARDGSSPAPAERAAGDASSPASLEGWRVDPRALFERKREPPQFIVSIVEPSADPLSTSLRETRPSISSTGTSGVNDGNFPR
jgi:hypothetical protein